MPITVNLDVMLAKRKMSLTELCEQMDIAYSNISILKNNRAKGVRFATLSRLCEILECTPCDILQYMNQEEYEKLFGKTEDDDEDE